MLCVCVCVWVCELTCLLEQLWKLNRLHERLAYSWHATSLPCMSLRVLVFHVLSEARRKGSPFNLVLSNHLFIPQILSGPLLYVSTRDTPSRVCAFWTFSPARQLSTEGLHHPEFECWHLKPKVMEWANRVPLIKMRSKRNLSSLKCGSQIHITVMNGVKKNLSSTQPYRLSTSSLHTDT